MATCGYCMKDMLVVDGCVEIEHPLANHLAKKPIPYGSEQRHPASDDRCHDCNVLLGKFHHPGCDWEECPHCGQQAIGCDCHPAVDVA